MNTLFDKYTLQARIYPVSILLFPAMLAFISCFFSDTRWWNLIESLIGTFGVAMLFAQVVAELGERQQELLYKVWGGPPTTNLLRYRSKALSREILDHFHKRLNAIVPDIALPLSFSEEAEDTDAADKKYEATVFVLRELTRDHEKFRLVAEEEINYGFRRNLWSMKRWGIIITIISVIVAGAAIIYPWSGIAKIPPFALMALLINCTLLFVWSIAVTTEWVHLAGIMYAKRLIGAADLLEPRPPVPPSVDGQYEGV